MPPKVHYADSVEQMFRTMLRIYDGRGLKVRIAIGMDEAQQHMLSDQNSDPVNQAMLSFLGVIRKFNVSLWFMSPTRMNLAPKIRNFIDDPQKAGNLDFLWFKDFPRIKKIIANNNLNKKPHQYITIQSGAEHRSRLLYVPETSWMTKVADLKPGQYGYDDEAAATFRYSDHPDFNHQTLLDMCSGIPKADIPEQIREYFEMLDAGEFAEKKKGSDQADQVSRLVRARDLKLPWKTIEAIEGENRSTLRSRMDKASSPKTNVSSKNGDGETCDGGTTSKEKET
jgi:hypothetical protein